MTKSRYALAIPSREEIQAKLVDKPTLDLEARWPLALVVYSNSKGLGAPAWGTNKDKFKAYLKEKWQGRELLSTHPDYDLKLCYENQHFEQEMDALRFSIPEAQQEPVLRASLALPAVRNSLLNELKKPSRAEARAIEAFKERFESEKEKFKAEIERRLSVLHKLQGEVGELLKLQADKPAQFLQEIEASQAKWLRHAANAPTWQRTIIRWRLSRAHITLLNAEERLGESSGVRGFDVEGLKEQLLYLAKLYHQGAVLRAKVNGVLVSEKRWEDDCFCLTQLTSAITTANLGNLLEIGTAKSLLALKPENFQVVASAVVAAKAFLVKFAEVDAHLSTFLSEKEIAQVQASRKICTKVVTRFAQITHFVQVEPSENPVYKTVQNHQDALELAHQKVVAELSKNCADQIDKLSGSHLLECFSQAIGLTLSPEQNNYLLTKLALAEKPSGRSLWQASITTKSQRIRALMVATLQQYAKDHDLLEQIGTRTFAIKHTDEETMREERSVDELDNLTSFRNKAYANFQSLLSTHTKPGLPGQQTRGASLFAAVDSQGKLRGEDGYCPKLMLQDQNRKPYPLTTRDDCVRFVYDHGSELKQPQQSYLVEKLTEAYQGKAHYRKAAAIVEALTGQGNRLNAVAEAVEIHTGLIGLGPTRGKKLWR